MGNRKRKGSIEARFELAMIYADDGGFHTAATILQEIADDMLARATAKDAAIAEFLATGRVSIAKVEL